MVNMMIQNMIVLKIEGLVNWSRSLFSRDHITPAYVRVEISPSLIQDPLVLRKQLFGSYKGSPKSIHIDRRMHDASLKARFGTVKFPFQGYYSS